MLWTEDLFQAVALAHPTYAASLLLGSWAVGGGLRSAALALDS